MKNYAFRLVNVFAETTLSANPLCVFEDARGLSSEQMQALALQFNLSETTFVLPPKSPGADAFVRIFAPGYEMRFAGHPTLGTAHVVHSLSRALSAPTGAARDGKVTLDFLAGLVPVWAELARYFFTTRGETVSEDPGTGSACANLGGWILHHGVGGVPSKFSLNAPMQWTISQGEQTGRACTLSLTINPERQIFVGGRVVELARGVVRL